QDWRSSLNNAVLKSVARRSLSRSPKCGTLHAHLLDGRSCGLRRKESNKPLGRLGFLRALHQSGSERLDELNLVRDRADEIDSCKGKDLTHGREYHIHFSRAYTGRSRI